MACSPHAGLRRGHAARDGSGGGRLSRGAPRRSGQEHGRQKHPLAGTGLLLLAGLLACALVLLAYEGCIIYELAVGPDLAFSVTIVLVNLGFFAAGRIPRWASPERGWYPLSKIVAGVGLSIRAIAGPAGWGHPLLFAIISYCGYAISVICLGLAVIQAARYLTRLRQGSGVG